MARNVRIFQCSPDAVWRVLSNGWLYPSWVVGASRMRRVDDAWPEAGATLQHSVGTWPALLDDETVVLECDRPHRLVLRAKGWPVGEARVTIDLKPRGKGTIVRIQEQAESGPARLIPRPIRDLLLYWRNTETLHRLAYLAEGMSSAPTGPTTADKELGSEE